MILKWTLAALGVFAAFIAGYLVGVFVDGYLHYWGLPWSGFCAAFSIVLASYLAAPSHKRAAARIILIIGAGAAWYLLEPSWYPEYYGNKAYQPTHLPLLATYIGGILGLVIAELFQRGRLD